MKKFLACALFTLAAGCTGTGTANVRYSGSATVASPQFVEIYPDVQVIEDYNEPVFYTDNSYWLYRQDGWYQSNDYRSGWVRVDSPPQRIRSIERPEGYVRYRGRADARRDRPQQPDIRDHRGPRADQGDAQRRLEAEERRKHDINAQRQREIEAEERRKHDINAQRQQQQQADAEAKRKHDINAQRQQESDAEAKRKHDINAQRAQEADAEAKRKHDINAKRQKDAETEAEAKRKYEINKARAQQK